jgi:hypothetical protein
MGLDAHGAVRRSGRGKYVRGIELLVPEEGIEPTRGVKGTGVRARTF